MNLICNNDIRMVIIASAIMIFLQKDGICMVIIDSDIFLQKDGICMVIIDSDIFPQKDFGGGVLRVQTVRPLES
jgi:hypothetical protein